jgi:hypothetical protein
MYSYRSKEILASKISKITKKKDLVTIFNILTENNINNNTNYVENDNGLFFLFHDLKPEIYIKLDEYISTAYPELNNNNEKSLSPLSSENNTDDNNTIEQEEIELETDNYSIEQSTDNTITKSDVKKIKYTNKEKNLIKRHNYDKKINKKPKNIKYCYLEL